MTFSNRLSEWIDGTLEEPHLRSPLVSIWLSCEVCRSEEQQLAADAWRVDDDLRCRDGIELARSLSVCIQAVFGILHTTQTDFTRACQTRAPHPRWRSEDRCPAICSQQ